MDRLSTIFILCAFYAAFLLYLAIGGYIAERIEKHDLSVHGLPESKTKMSRKLRYIPGDPKSKYRAQ